MATYKNFEEILVWQLARDFCNDLDSVIDDSWYRKDSSLKNQILASSGSIMDNVAEGFERGSTNEFKTFLAYAKGSCGESRSQLYRASDKKMLNETDFERLKCKTVEISKQLNGFISYLKSVPHKGNRFEEPAVQYGQTMDDFYSVITNFVPNDNGTTTSNFPITSVPPISNFKSPISNA
jgi:four helix bundle protein